MITDVPSDHKATTFVVVGAVVLVTGAFLLWYRSLPKDTYPAESPIVSQEARATATPESTPAGVLASPGTSLSTSQNPLTGAYKNPFE